MEPWYKVATPRKEVREGRSFNPDEFAIALEQVVSGAAPLDYRDPVEFLSRTCWTRALREHAIMTLKRLSGETAGVPPVMALITQFGGGKTHTLTLLYHLTRNYKMISHLPEIKNILTDAGLSELPHPKVAVFVGNAWDPSSNNPSPWIDIARQLAGEEGIHALGPSAATTAPGTENIQKMIDAAGGSVLILFDEVLNFLNRHKDMSGDFKAFLGNLVRTMTGTIRCAAMLSLPQSKPEMDDWELRWQDIITKEIGRVAKQLIVNDEAEISEVVRRRLFENIGSDRIRKNVSKTYADWCFEHRAQLPSEWTAVDTATTESKAREFLAKRFEACYPFHPATLSVFQRKWQALPQYQQTRGTLAMLAQWISWAYKTAFAEARREPLITLGSAPLESPDFRSVVLGQLGESRLVAAIDADISGAQSHARALDADTKAALRDIHRRVGVSILFESSGGQTDKNAHLPELRFALGEPEVDTTSVDNAAFALEDKSYFMRREGTDGFKINYKPTLKKVVNDRRASLDEETEIKPAMQKLIKKEFARGSNIPIIFFPTDGESVQDTPRLTIIIVDPETEWSGEDSIRKQIAEWTRQRGKSPRLYPGSLVWWLKKPGRELRDNIEIWLAWQHVVKEIREGSLAIEFDRSENAEIQSKMTDAEESAKDEIWGGYRFVLIADNQEPDGLQCIDLGAGHSSANETLCSRLVTTMKSRGLLNESVGAGYIERNWPPAFMESGAWPLASLRQSFLNGSLTRLLDPDATLRSKVIEFVAKGDFGLASGMKEGGEYEHVWFNESISPDEVSFDSGVFLLLKSRATSIKSAGDILKTSIQEQKPLSGTKTPSDIPCATPTATIPNVRVIRITGSVPPEVWNRLGTKILPKLRSSSDLRINIDFNATVNSQEAENLINDLNLILNDLGISDKIRIE